MTIDPLKITNNWYVYTSNRPTMLIDPNGKIAIIPILCASACACVALCGIAIIGGCIAGCHDAGNLSWECIGSCIDEVIQEMPDFQKALCAACLVGCGLCLTCKFLKICHPPDPPHPDPPSRDNNGDNNDGKQECPPNKYDPLDCIPAWGDCMDECYKHFAIGWDEWDDLRGCLWCCDQLAKRCIEGKNPPDGKRWGYICVKMFLQPPPIPRAHLWRVKYYGFKQNTTIITKTQTSA